MNIRNNISELVGHTPLMRMGNFMREYGSDAEILAKLEYFNPAGSVKDRVALAMINAAEAEGKITPNTVIIEPTSGNTGIGLAAVAASRGYTVVLTMPDTMSVERRRLLAAYGAKLVLTDGKKGMSGAIEKAEELKNEYPDSFVAGQFVNPVNPQAHIESTGPEIWEDTDGLVDIFVAGVGTGGTISGVGKYLKSKNPDIKIVAVEPDTSAVLSGKEAGAHKLQGIGAGFIPKITDLSVIDEIMPVSAEDAFKAGRICAAKEGILVGITSGAALHAASVLALRPENKGKKIVSLLPDTGERYLTSEMFT